MIEISTKEFYCDGPEDGEHPRVYYIIDDASDEHFGADFGVSLYITY